MTSLRSKVEIVTKGLGCPDGCGGTGLQLYNEYKNHLSRLEVIVRVCPCVRLAIKGRKIIEAK